MRKLNYQAPLTEVQRLDIENICGYPTSPNTESGNTHLSRDGGFIEEEETDWEE